MEETLFSINNLKSMEVIDINQGKKLGYISDLKIDCDESKILAIIIPEEKSSWFSKVEDLEIAWSDVVKVGMDVILVNANIKSNPELDKYI